MLEWLQQSNFMGPSDAAAQPPRASLRLNHVELVTEKYLSNPAFNPDDESVPEDVRAIAKNRMRLDRQREQMAQERAREQVELRFGPFTYTVRAGGTARIATYNGSNRIVDVPEQISDYTVTALDNCVFAGHDEIEEINISDTVEILGHHLFEKCTGLRSVRLPGGLKQVGAGVFSGCGCIRSVQVNSAVVSAEMKLLSGVSIEELAFGPQVREFDSSGFEIKDLERVSIDSANEELMSDGFSVFSKDGSTLICLVVPVERYAVPEGCVHIADRAFDSMKCLRAVTLPGSLRSIGRLSFAKTSLNSIDFPEGLESVGDKAFFFCSSLFEVALPASVRFLGSEAFASSGVTKARIPSSLEFFGHGVFEHTPVQLGVHQGSIKVMGDSSAEESDCSLRIDDSGGVYLGDSFLELIGQVSDYCVAPGTQVVAANACKRHRALRRIYLPEGVLEIGDEAFRGCKNLCLADLPESLQRIGARAFMGTSLSALRISASVNEIGGCALLVQGENPLTATRPLASLDLDPANDRFYLHEGMLCERGRADDDDAVLLYLGPDHIVHIPDKVTRIGVMAFCGAAGIGELYLHNHIKGIYTGAFSTKQTIDVLNLSFACQVDGAREVRLIMPEYTSRYRSMMPLFETSDKETGFNFEYYDTWVSCSTNISEFAPAAYARLKHPVRLSDRCRDLYEGTFTRKAQAVVRYFSDKGDIEALMQLMSWGFIDGRHIQRELDASLETGAAQKTACLLEVRRRMAGFSVGNIDFSL